MLEPEKTGTQDNISIPPPPPPPARPLPETPMNQMAHCFKSMNEIKEEKNKLGCCRGTLRAALQRRFDLCIT
jgi:hypothetical protein